MSCKPFSIERAKQGRASCKKCKVACEKGELRIAKLNPNNPFGEGPLKAWYHLDCFFTLKQTKNSKLLETSDEIEGWTELSADDKKTVTSKAGAGFKEVTVDASKKRARDDEDSDDDANDVKKPRTANSIDKFVEYQKLIKKVENVSSYTEKSRIIRNLLFEGDFGGETELWLRFLMPKETMARVYNLQDKQICKLFSLLLAVKQSDVATHLEESGDVSETVANFFEKSRKLKPKSESSLTLQEVDEFLDRLQNLTHEKDQISHFEVFCGKSTADDLKTVIRIIKNDLKMNCRARHVLDALHADAYENFQRSRDLKTVLSTFASTSSSSASTGKAKKTKSGLQLMIPVAPMLAEACKDFDKAVGKCPGGFYSEIKYDGERVQIHKQGNEFKFFSRNLKPVTDYKIDKFRDYLSKAFRHGNDLILDSEILMVDTVTDELLPFGTLGKHKKEEHKNAVTCLFVFDCLFFNGEDLTGKSMKERRKFLEENLTVIKHHIQLSEYRLLKTKDDLVDMTKEVLQKGLEGLVLKGANTVYEPGKRRWFKVKKDYLMKGAIADTADLVVLGAWFGKGKMGGVYSIFLMGCLDERKEIWKTVTKVHSGLDDKEMEKMHEKLTKLMEKCGKNTRIPRWLHLNRTMIPNAIAKDPLKMPVFEITGAEFTNSEVHTANSISIRFPRITRVRDDKSPKEATKLSELTHLYNESKSGMHLNELDKLKSASTPTKSNTSSSSSTKVKQESLDKFVQSKSNTKRESAASDKTKDSTSSSPAKKIAKVDKTEELSTAVDIFSSFTLFVSQDMQEFQDDIDNFRKFGGKIASSSKKANLTLHSDLVVKGSLDEMRSLYKPECKHYHISWLRDSIEAESLKDSTSYFVKLQQN